MDSVISDSDALINKFECGITGVILSGNNSPYSAHYIRKIRIILGAIKADSRVLIILPKSAFQVWYDHIPTAVNYTGSHRALDNSNFVISTSNTLSADLNNVWKAYDCCTDLHKLRDKYAPCYNIQWDYLICDNIEHSTKFELHVYQAIYALRRQRTILLVDKIFGNAHIQSYLLNMYVPVNNASNQFAVWILTNDCQQIHGSPALAAKLDMVTNAPAFPCECDNTLHYFAKNILACMKIINPSDRVIVNYMFKIQKIKKLIADTKFSDIPSNNSPGKISIIRLALNCLLELDHDCYHEIITQDGDIFGPGGKLFKVVYRNMVFYQWKLFWYDKENISFNKCEWSMYRTCTISQYNCLKICADKRTADVYNALQNNHDMRSIFKMRDCLLYPEIDNANYYIHAVENNIEIPLPTSAKIEFILNYTNQRTVIYSYCYSLLCIIKAYLRRKMIDAEIVRTHNAIVTASIILTSLDIELELNSPEVILFCEPSWVSNKKESDIIKKYKSTASIISLLSTIENHDTIDQYIYTATKEKKTHAEKIAGFLH